MEVKRERKEGANRRITERMKETMPVKTKEKSQDPILRGSAERCRRFVTGCEEMVVVRSQEGMIFNWLEASKLSEP